MKNRLRTASDVHTAKELLGALRKSDFKQEKKNVLSKAEKITDRVLGYVLMLLIGVVMGYAWCFLAFVE